MSPYVSHVTEELLGLLLLSQQSHVSRQEFDLENAQTTVTVERPNIATQCTTVAIKTMQGNTIPARVYLDFTIRGQARADVRLFRSSGRRHSAQDSFYWAGTIQCAAFICPYR